MQSQSHTSRSSAHFSGPELIREGLSECGVFQAKEKNDCPDCFKCSEGISACGIMGNLKICEATINAESTNMFRSNSKATYDNRNPMLSSCFADETKVCVRVAGSRK